MHIFQDKTSFDTPVWVCQHECFLYFGDSLEDLIKVLNNEWESDRHLVG